MACEHSVIRWLHSERVRGCEDCDTATEYEQVDHEEGCFVASCDCGYESYDCECKHEVIRWLHEERVRGCESCDNATEYEQGELTPCDLTVCCDCGASVEPTTDAHHKQLLADA